MSDKLSQAVTAIKAGDKQTGKHLLIEILKMEPHNENAWLWMTQVVTKKDEKIKCLERVLKINPGNEMAQKGMARLRPVGSPSLDDIAPESDAPIVQRKKGERTESAIKRLEKTGKRRSTSRPNDQQLIQQYIAKRTSQGWQVVNQTNTSVQMHKPKRWSTTLLVLGGVLLIFFGVGLIFWVLAVIDYAIKKDQTIFVTADELRQGTDKKPASSMKGLLIVAGVLIGGFVLCIGFTLLPALFISPSNNNSSTANQPVQESEASAPQNPPASTPIALQGNIRITRQRLVQHFENQGFSWREETYSDGTHFMSGQSPDRTQKINLWSTENPEDLTEICFSFNFLHDVYYLPDKNDDERFRKGLQAMVETQAIIFPDWSEGESWIKTGLESLPEPLSRDKELETNVNGADVYLGIGDLSETEYGVSLSIVD